MTEKLELKLNFGLDYILNQLAHGNTIEGLKVGKVWMGLEQVKEWKSKFGFQFQIYSNDHFIQNRPHFHIIKKSEEIDCRLFFDGEIYDCKGKNRLDVKTRKAIIYFVSDSKRQILLKKFWNNKNPQLKISN
jgi:hypothetical protein